MDSFYERYDGVNMKDFIIWLSLFITLLVGIVLIGACAGLFFGAAWKAFCWVV